MTEMKAGTGARLIKIRHRGRGSQVWIYLGKMLRMFVYQNDWKVLPMAALIAGLVGMVIKSRLFVSMEGTLMSSFALVMVCIWNGCFNSIQVICRERDVIKREHRSGMHISSYIFSHMIYQALLCMMQTAVTLYVTSLVGVNYHEKGLFTRWLIVDFGISMFLISYASDMLSLWVSSLSRSTTTAMTIMPFVLIFQLVFSGGMLALPKWTERITPLTISNPALKVITAQSNYNAQPVKTVWNTVNGMRNRDVDISVTPRQVLNLLQNGENETIASLRSTVILEDHTLGELIDSLAEDQSAQESLDTAYSFHSTVGELISMIGEEKVQDILQNKIAEASQIADYEYSRINILEYWLRLIFFIFLFAALATVTLEFVDKDKR